MVDLYVSYKVLTDCLKQEEEKNPLRIILNREVVDVFVDIEIDILDKLMIAEDDQIASTNGYENFSELFDFINDNDIHLYSGKERMDIIKKRGKLKYAPSSAIFIYESIKDEDISEIQKKYGVVCLSGNKLNSLNLSEKRGFQHYWDTEKDDEQGSWEEIIKSLPAYPCNSIIFCDRYLKNDKKYKNIPDIIKAFDKNNAFNKDKEGCQIQILFICEYIKDTGAQEIANNFSEKIFSVFKDVKDAKVRIEFVFCKDDYSCELYKHIHNRRILTNFSMISADHSLAVFDNDGKPLTDQRLTYDLIFSETIESEYKTIINKIASDIKKLRVVIKPGQEKTDKDKTYLFMCASSDVKDEKGVNIVNPDCS